MLVAVADTHAIVWYIFDDPRLSSSVRTFFVNVADEGNHVGFSPITYAELVYLVEKDRVQSQVLEILSLELDKPDSALIELPFDRVTALWLREIDRAQVPDLPDRIIAATALEHSVPLITRDRRIEASNVHTIW